MPLAEPVDTTVTLDQGYDRPWQVVMDDIPALVMKVYAFRGDICGDQ